MHPVLWWPRELNILHIKKTDAIQAHEEHVHQVENTCTEDCKKNVHIGGKLFLN